MSSFFSEAAVLRCSRCGSFVDWTDAQAQVVCSAARIDLPPVLVRKPPTASAAALELFRRDFGTSANRGVRPADGSDAAPTIVAEMNGELGGALAYRLVEGGLHIIALASDPMWQRSGVGGHLLAEAELMARRLRIPRVIVSLTNDNLPALYFYQRRGYSVAEWTPNGAAAHVKTTVRGFGGIPVRDEVRLEKRLEIDR
jgi:GNAT superfamily N-acetyltransferase